MRHVSLHRWAGSKMRIIDDILTRLRPQDYKRAIVPFWGSGVDGRAFAQSGCEVIGADSCSELIAAHRCVASGPDALIGALDVHFDECATDPEGHYYAVRSGKINLPPAIRFFYLVGASFNGLWRQNADGKFNVPFGRPFSFDAEAIRVASGQMSSVTLSHAGWRETLDGTERGDLVYCDPPYYGDYDGYGGGAFDARETRALVETLATLAGRGRACWMSNSPKAGRIVLSVCPSATIHRIAARRSIAADGGNRGDVPEILVKF